MRRPTVLGQPGVVIGLVGSLLAGLTACGNHWSYRPGGWADPTIHAIGDWVPELAGRVLMVVGVALLSWGWWGLRGRDVPAARVLALWSLPLLLVPPVLSADAVLYADLGWSVGHGLNPYDVGLATSGGPFAASVDPLWAGNGVAYPPLALWASAAAVAICGAHPYWSIVAQRLPALLGVALLAWVLPRLARAVGADGRRALWLGLLNPLVVLHFVGGAHNDAPMVGVALLGVWLAVRGGSLLELGERRDGRARRWVWSLVIAPVVIGVAMALKQQAGLAVVAVAGLPIAGDLLRASLAKRLWLLGWRSAVAAAVAGTTFVAISVATGLGFGWTKWLSQMGRTGTAAPFFLVSWVGEQLLKLNGQDAGPYVHAVELASTLSILVALALLAWRFADRPLALLGWGALAVAGLGQALHPWYVAWPVAVLSLVALTRRQFGWVVALVIGFVVWNSIQTVGWASAPA